MKIVKLAAAAAIAVSATTATAGGLAPAVVDTPMVMIDEPGSSLGGMLIPAILLALLAVAASSSNS